MEPWPFSHGNALRQDNHLAKTNPSMEPWPFSHGNALRQDNHLAKTNPSMEPWPFSHGNIEGTMFKQAAMYHLQWSHGPLAMET